MANTGRIRAPGWLVRNVDEAGALLAPIKKAAQELADAKDTGQNNEVKDQLLGPLREIVPSIIGKGTPGISAGAVRYSQFQEEKGGEKDEIPGGIRTSGERPLEGTQAEDVSGLKEEPEADTGTKRGPGEDVRRDVRSDIEGAPGTRGVGDREGEIRPASKRRRHATLGGTTE